MILFFGWKVRFATVSEGQFHCPYCRADRPCERQLARRWFTLFFLPILPLKVLGEVVRCRYCHNHFDLRALDIPTSAVTTEQLLAAWREATTLLLRIDDSPAARSRAVAVISAVSPSPWTESFVDHDVRSLDVAHLPERLHVLAAVLTEQGKEHVLSAAASVPAASGAISAPVRVALQQMAADLGMTAAHGRGVIAEQLEPRIDTWGPPAS